jgi:HPt (histidine-containing phosphotransfer) domain-containing protein
MTLQELYASIGENCDQALRVLRVEKLVDKHIRRLPTNGVIESLLSAGETMDPVRLFEAAHAAKGNCANLGLMKLSAAASEIAEEYRPGNPRTMSDEEVKEKLRDIAVLYEQTVEAIRRYEAENP